MGAWRTGSTRTLSVDRATTGSRRQSGSSIATRWTGHSWASAAGRLCDCFGRNCSRVLFGVQHRTVPQPLPEHSGCAQFTVPQLPFDDGGAWGQSGPVACSVTVARSTGSAVVVLSLGARLHPRHERHWLVASEPGPSRADLVAFASLVAVERGTARHNWACDGDRKGPHNGPTQCLQFEGSRVAASRRVALCGSDGSVRLCERDPPYRRQSVSIIPMNTLTARWPCASWRRSLAFQPGRQLPSWGRILWAGFIEAVRTSMFGPPTRRSTANISAT